MAKGRVTRNPEMGALSVVDQTIKESVEKYLLNLIKAGIPVTFGVVYGAQATDQADPWGDINLLVVSPRFDIQATWEDTRLLWRLAAQTDNRIEPIPVGVRQFAEDDSNAIFEIARRYGQIIPLAD
jgi:predicted nucleotidyltransferase